MTASNPITFTAESLEVDVERVVKEYPYHYIDNQTDAFALLDAVLRADSVGLISLSDEIMQRFIERVYSSDWADVSTKDTVTPHLSELRRKNAAGYVYLLQSPTGAYKIGRTKNPANRLATFSVKLPFEVSYICVIKTDDMYALERELHGRFSERHINGEWFALTNIEISYMELMADGEL